MIEERITIEPASDLGTAHHRVGRTGLACRELQKDDFKSVYDYAARLAV